MVFFFSTQNEIPNTEVIQMDHFQAVQQKDQTMPNMQLAEMKNAVIKHMFFAAVSNDQLMLFKCKI